MSTDIKRKNLYLIGYLIVLISVTFNADFLGATSTPTPPRAVRLSGSSVRQVHELTIRPFNSNANEYNFTLAKKFILQQKGLQNITWQGTWQGTVPICWKYIKLPTIDLHHFTFLEHIQNRKKARTSAQGTARYLPTPTNYYTVFTSGKIIKSTITNLYLCRMMTESDDELMSGEWLTREYSGPSSAAATLIVSDQLSSSRTEAPITHGQDPDQLPTGISSETKVNAIDDDSLSSNSTGTGVTSSDPRGNCAAYIQCKSARTAGLRTPATDTTFGKTIGKTVFMEKSRVGSLETGSDPLFTETFRGSRICSNGQSVNQNISFSFDPATMNCCICKSHHNIIPNNSGVVFLVSDQNFVSALSGKESCVPVCRLEDASLMELADLVIEILDRHTVPPGTLFLLNSTSYLSKVGSTKYAYDWIEACRRLNGRWQQVKVGPLPPVLREDCDSSVGKQMVEIFTWFSKVYADSPVFVKSAWQSAIAAIASTDEHGLDLGHKEVYSVAFPSSLYDLTMFTMTFFLSSSHTVTQTFDDTATNELIRNLIDTLNTDFGINANSGDILCREPAECTVPMDQNDHQIPVIIIGASHAGRIASKLKMRGCDVTDLSIPGWTATPPNLLRMKEEVANLGDIKDTCVILDLFSNSTYRYVTEDGELAPPMKLDGVYHMAGKVATCSKETIGTIVSNAKSVLQHLPGQKIVLPPLPRYLYQGCCTRTGHCKGVGTEDTVTELIESTLCLKKVIAAAFVKNGAKNFTVPSVLQDTFGTTAKEIGTNLKKVTSVDGVHLTHSGYCAIADTLKKCITTVSAPSSLVAGTPRPGYFWRGFLSPVGTPRVKQHAQTYKQQRLGGSFSRKRVHSDSRGGGPSRGGPRGRGSFRGRN